ncbi:MAG: DNA polymerase III subunit gamma/tau [Prevotella sp.]|nr:DNA polymerase III subunit gamma/tau [Prevotella sp.]
MNEYIVSARKYRPMKFSDVVGQDALTTTLRNTVKSGKLAHAYLFCGPRGVGKTTCARIFAKAINCEHPTDSGEACGACESCKAFEEGRSFNIFELDAASNNGVDQIKQLMEQTRIPPQVGRYKVFIIDEVHMLSQQAFNAFLKTLEEPPAHVIFILATTEKHKILPTILSRCQIYDFERMSVAHIIQQLKMVADREKISYEEEALGVIAEKADGGMRDALSIFDQVASFSQGNVTFEKTIEDLNVLDADNYFKTVFLALDNKVADIMLLLNGVLAKGFDGGNFIVGLASHIRNVLMAKDPQTLPLLEVSDRQREQYREQAQKCPARFLYQALRIANRCDVQYRQSSNKRLLVELTLIEIAQITQPEDDAAGAGRSPKQLKTLFQKLLRQVQPERGAQVAPVAQRKRQHAQQTVQPATDQSQSADQKADQRTETKPTQQSSETVRTAPPAGALKSAKLNLGRSMGMSFGDILTHKDKPTAEQTVEVENAEERNAFTEEDLLVQWRAMCTRMPENMRAMSTRMRNLSPVITDYPNVEIVAENQILYDQMLTIKSRIRATLAKCLKNGSLQVSIRLAKQDEIKPLLSPKETLDQLVKENTAVGRLVQSLSLDLA